MLKIKKSNINRISNWDIFILLRNYDFILTFAITAKLDVVLRKNPLFERDTLMRALA